MGTPPNRPTPDSRSPGTPPRKKKSSRSGAVAIDLREALVTASPSRGNRSAALEQIARAVTSAALKRTPVEIDLRGAVLDEPSALALSDLLAAGVSRLDLRRCEGLAPSTLLDLQRAAPPGTVVLLESRTVGEEGGAAQSAAASQDATQLPLQDRAAEVMAPPPRAPRDSPPEAGASVVRAEAASAGANGGEIGGAHGSDRNGRTISRSSSLGSIGSASSDGSRPGRARRKPPLPAAAVAPLSDERRIRRILTPSRSVPELGGRSTPRSAPANGVGYAGIAAKSAEIRDSSPSKSPKPPTPRLDARARAHRPPPPETGTTYATWAWAPTNGEATAATRPTSAGPTQPAAVARSRPAAAASSDRPAAATATVTASPHAPSSSAPSTRAKKPRAPSAPKPAEKSAEKRREKGQPAPRGVDGDADEYVSVKRGELRELVLALQARSCEIRARCVARSRVEARPRRPQPSTWHVARRVCARSGRRARRRSRRRVPRYARSAAVPPRIPRCHFRPRSTHL